MQTRARNHAAGLFTFAKVKVFSSRPPGSCGCTLPGSWSVKCATALQCLNRAQLSKGVVRSSLACGFTSMDEEDEDDLASTFDHAAHVIASRYWNRFPCTQVQLVACYLPYPENLEFILHQDDYFTVQQPTTYTKCIK